MSEMQPGPPEVPPEFSAWQRVDPRTLIVHMVPVLFVLFLFLAPLQAANRAGGGPGDYVDLLFPLAGVAGVGVRWYTGRYSVAEGAVRWRVGLIVQRSTDIGLDRIQDVEVTRPLLTRMLGLAQVSVSSAGGAGEIKLHYLDHQVAERLGHLLQGEIATHRRIAAGQGVPTAAVGMSAEASAAPPVELHKVSSSELFMWAWYRGWVAIPIVVIAVVVAAFVDVRALIPLIPVLPFGGINLIKPLFDRTNMTVTIDATSLFTAEGLTTVRRTSTQRERVQLIYGYQRWLQRLRGCETVRFASADVTLQKGESTIREELALNVPADSWGVMAATVAHRQVIGPAWLRSKPAATATVTRLRWTIVGVVVGVVAGSIAAAASGATAIANGGAVTSGCLLLPPIAGAVFGTVRGRSRSRVEGWAVSADDLLVRDGLIHRRTLLLFAAKTQSVEIVSGPLQRRLGLVTVQVDAAPPGHGNRIAVHDVTIADGRLLLATLTAAGSRPLPGGV